MCHTPLNSYQNSYSEFDLNITAHFCQCFSQMCDGLKNLEIFYF